MARSPTATSTHTDRRQSGPGMQSGDRRVGGGPAQGPGQGRTGRFAAAHSGGSDRLTGVTEVAVSRARCSTIASRILHLFAAL